jgi:hypothetical protein
MRNTKANPSAIIQDELSECIRRSKIFKKKLSLYSPRITLLVAYHEVVVLWDAAVVVTQF